MRPPLAPRAIAFVVSAMMSIALAGCASTPGGSPDARSPRVVATTTVLADLVRNVAGPQVEVNSLVPAGVDVHTYDPAPSDVQRVADADLILANGLGLDDWLTDLVRDSATGATVVELAVDLPGVEYIEGGHRHSDEADGDDIDETDEADGDETERVNPHLWLDVSIAQRYVDRIGEALAAADPSGAAGYAERATAYSARLATLHDEVVARFAAVPEGSRRVVSFHDAFPYFARAYGLDIVGVVLEAPGQEPSAGEVAALIDGIRASGARAILSEVQFNDQLARQIAAETGVTVVSDLYTDALGASPVDSFEGLIRWDVERIVAALS